MRRYRARLRAAQPPRAPRTRQLLRCPCCGHLVRGQNIGYRGHALELVVVQYTGGNTGFAYERGQPIPLDLLEALLDQLRDAEHRVLAEMRVRRDQQYHARMDAIWGVHAPLSGTSTLHVPPVASYHVAVHSRALVRPAVVRTKEQEDAA